MFVEQFVRWTNRICVFHVGGLLVSVIEGSHTYRQTEAELSLAVTLMRPELPELLYRLNAAITASNSPQVSAVQ